jgi:biofilm PGA synthesis N-glycosyltransferase PgaC
MPVRNGVRSTERVQNNTGIHRVTWPDDELGRAPAQPSQARIALPRPAPVPDPAARAPERVNPREGRDETARRHGKARQFYLPVRAKFAIALVLSMAWTVLSTLLALPWLHDLAAIMTWPVAIFAVGGIAVLPGMMNSFLVVSLLLDRRPARRRLVDYPAVSILVAAYNEESSIADTLKSIAAQEYPGEFEVLVIDDGSRDATAAIVEANPYPWARLLRQPRNMGKAAALNRGLAESQYDYVITLDADSYLYGDALARLVERYFSDPANTRAVAGTMLVRNSRTNWITSAQEWDYFHGISAIKRVQSLFQGTMVAQGAFSMYDRAALEDVGGWQDCVGEDIVLTWAMLVRGWRVGHAEDACCFTNAPDNLKQFIRQRQRWSRGMMEAFRQHPRILLTPRMSTLFVWWNVLFPWLDLAYTLFFIPGMIAACFGIFWIVGPLTLVLLPMALAMNYLMYRIGVGMFAGQGLRVRKNVTGFLIYALTYSLILQPASVAGYMSELLGLRKTWGSK